MAGKKASTSVPRLNQISVQTSAYGVTIPAGWGTFRCSVNIGYVGPLQSQAVKQKSGGKGGNSTVSSYNYWADVILLMCEGPITGVKEVFKDSAHYVDGDLHTRYTNIASALTAVGNIGLASDYTTLTSLAAGINTGSTTALQSAGLSLATGTVGQAPQGFLTGDHALGYSQTAYVWAQNYAFSSSATLPNHSLTVSSNIRATVNGHVLDDANPADIISDALTNSGYGLPSWPAGAIGDLTEYRTANTAYSFFLSPVLDSQSTASSFIDDLMTASNAACFWSEGVLKVRPYSDTAKTANGVTFTPDLTPIYSLTDDDYIVDGDADPVEVTIKAPADAYNIVQVEYEDRTHAYNTATVPANDQASIDQYGPRKQDPISLRSIKMPSIATQLAQVLVQRSANVWRTYKFRLGDEFALLEPMDLLEISDSVLGLTNKLVRITEIDEDGTDGSFLITAEEMLVGASHAPLISRQTPVAVITNYDVAPGNVNTPVLINPERAITTANQPELWIAVSGGPNWGGCEVWVSLDGTNYSKEGVVNGGARYGVLTATLNTGSDPDTVNTLHLDMSPSGGELTSTSTTAADGNANLSMVGSELVSFATATLTGLNTYDVTYLRRGLYGTSIAAHGMGTEFIRLDDAIFKYPYTTEQAGTDIFVKFLSFNGFGRAMQSLADVSPYTITLDPGAPPTVDVVATSIVGQGTGATTNVGDLATKNTADTPDITANAVTNSHFYTGTNVYLPDTTTANTAISGTITTVGGYVIIHATFVTTIVSGGGRWTMDVYRDGSSIGTVPYLQNGNFPSCWSLDWIDASPPAGSHTYEIHMDYVTGDTDVRFSYVSLSLTENKR